MEQDYRLVCNTMARYIHLVDGQDFDRLDEVFDAESVWVTANGTEVVGVDNIATMLRMLVQFRPRLDRHVVTNVIVDIDGDRATSSSHWSWELYDDDRRTWVTASTGSYDDELRQTGGRWRFARRTLLPNDERR